MERRVEFIGSGYEVVRFIMVDTPTMAEAYEAAERWYKETGQDFHYCEMEIPKEYAFNESQKKEAVSAAPRLSEKARELFDFLWEDYKESGYLYSGSWPYESLRQRGFEKEVIQELRDAGRIQRRNCDDYAFELSTEVRGELVMRYNLCSVWYEKVGDALLPEIQQEAKSASGIITNQDTGKVTVRTVKNVGDMEKPDKVEVACSFAVGQVVNLKYDLPKTPWFDSASQQGYLPGGKAVGQFMVTDVVHNLLVQPSTNLIEVQSLCEEFNELYPQKRSMLVFEDVMLERMKELDGTLEQKILEAGERSGQRSENDKARDFEVDKE